MADGSGPVHAARLLADRSTRLGRIVRARAAAWPGVALLGLLVSLLEGIGIGILVPIAALLLSPGAGGTLPQPFAGIIALGGDADPVSLVALLGALVLLAIILKTVLQAANALLIARIDVSVARAVIDTMARRILAMPYGTYLVTDRDRLLHVLSTDSWDVAEAVRAALSLIPALAGLAVFALLLVWLDPILFVIVVAGAGLLAFLLHLIARRQRSLGARANRRNRALGWRMLSLVENLRTIRLFGEEGRVSAKRARIAMPICTASSVAG